MADLNAIAPAPDPPAEEVLAVVARGERAPHVRAYSPAPTVAFGRLDAIRPGYEAAREAALRHGFSPVLRAAGGHAAPYHRGCLVVEEFGRGADAMVGVQERFAERGEALAGALRTLGVDAGVGEVPGEYCPGRFSVHARHRVKLVGTAQRVVRGAWLFGAVVVVEDAAVLRAVVRDVYAALHLDVDPEAVGAVAEEAPGVTVEDVWRAVQAAGSRC